MKRFKSASQAQRFPSAHDQSNNLFHLRCDHVPPASIERQGGVRLRHGPTSPGLLSQLELRANVALGGTRDDNLTVPVQLPACKEAASAVKSGRMTGRSTARSGGAILPLKMKGWHGRSAPFEL
jgi:hypothetical protein